ncbi:hypothetical protein N0Y54_28795 [Nostoc punctiforme UO1]|uniref:hypothetical protein n=1 Tax=Nostoc punctiforme TaxID=272131 RepID=UPI0030AD1B5F
MRGASPQTVESVSELEDSPTANDCTTLTLVDAAQDEYTSLLAENQDCGVEPAISHEGTCSAAPATSAEKWSHEAIVARANVRPERMQKLKVAANSGQNPGFEYLLSCWSDDPALQIVIKKLLAKCPQWGIAIVDGVLVEPQR